MKTHPAVRLEQQRANLKRLETAARRTATLIKKRKASIRALERSVAKVGPAPPAPVKVPRDRKKPVDADLAMLNEWGRKAAAVIGVKAPKVRWAGTKGACKRVARAHIHTDKGYWRTERRANGQTWRVPIRRGDCCVRRGYGVSSPERARDLMAHETAHLGGRGKRERFGHGNGHGERFQATMRRILDALGATEEEAVEAAAEMLDDLEVAA